MSSPRVRAPPGSSQAAPAEKAHSKDLKSQEARCQQLMQLAMATPLDPLHEEDFSDSEVEVPGDVAQCTSYEPIVDTAEVIELYELKVECLTKELGMAKRVVSCHTGQLKELYKKLKIAEHKKKSSMVELGQCYINLEKTEDKSNYWKNEVAKLLQQKETAEEEHAEEVNYLKEQLKFYQDTLTSLKEFVLPVLSKVPPSSSSASFEETRAEESANLLLPPAAKAKGAAKPAKAKATSSQELEED